MYELVKNIDTKHFIFCYEEFIFLQNGKLYSINAEKDDKGINFDNGKHILFPSFELKDLDHQLTEENDISKKLENLKDLNFVFDGSSKNILSARQLTNTVKLFHLVDFDSNIISQLKEKLKSHFSNQYYEQMKSYFEVSPVTLKDRESVFKLISLLRKSEIYRFWPLVEDKRDEYENLIYKIFEIIQYDFNLNYQEQYIQLENEFISKSTNIVTLIYKVIKISTQLSKEVKKIVGQFNNIGQILSYKDMLKIAQFQEAHPILQDINSSAFELDDKIVSTIWPTAPIFPALKFEENHQQKFAEFGKTLFNSLITTIERNLEKMKTHPSVPLFKQTNYLLKSAEEVANEIYSIGDDYAQVILPISIFQVLEVYYNRLKEIKHKIT
eukprot:TRINITY_DN13420_c0_g2_i1.p1 TRINITY_DN13420_c0_g2~~TRINITY_DN13420_c0_g2_i1.p1  ORF type:complete len:428 (+),score=110.77 TRINITY_DN13420_c0_g2_i1:136-1284(+)